MAAVAVQRDFSGRWPLMHKLTRVSAVLVGVLGASGVCSAALVACSNDTSGIIPDGGTDAASDRTTPPHETGPKPDVGPKPDAGHDATQDVTHPPDVAPPIESSTDSGKDTGIDAPLDAPTDAHADVSAAAAAFPKSVVMAYCAKLGSCCGEGPSAFSVSACVDSLYDSRSFVPSQLALILSGLQSTEHTFDPTQADKCTTEIGALGCGSTAATTWKQIAIDCAGAYAGELGTNATGCYSSFDCKAGNYCAPLDPLGNTIPPDGGGTCTALAGANGACVDIQNSSDCTYLGLGTPAQYCNNYPTDGGAPTDGGVCSPSFASGTACNFPGWAQECTSLQCLPTMDAGNFFYDYACTDSAGFTQIEGAPQCLLFPPDGG
jgi:hypothetical protein